MKSLVLIPARGGSKGIKYKNIVELAGKPLLAYTIEAARESGVADKIYISSDDDKILAVAQAHHAEIIRRNPALAQDETPTNPVIEEFIARAELNSTDIIILLQPTSPLRTAQHINEALTLFRANESCSALMSMYEADNKYLYAYVAGETFLNPIAHEYRTISRRQDLPAVYLPNGAIYIFTVAAFNQQKKIPQDRLIAYVMNKDISIDIDTPDDLKKAEEYLSRNKDSHE